MPTIRLKPNSPDYADPHQVRPRMARTCDMPGCTAPGEHRAPKDRALSDYYSFCRTHAEDYNRAWDFFDGMAQSDVETMIVSALYGERPTWRQDSYRGMDDALRRKVWQAYNFTEDETPPPPQHPTGNPELDALAIMGLTAPVSFETIKARYRELVKRYHPDSAGNDHNAQDLIKQVNMAYTILKMAYRDDSASRTA